MKTKTGKMAKNKKQYEKIFNIEISMKSNGTSDDWERYEAVLIAFGNSVFQQGIGTWGGRETAFGKPFDDLVRTNYWYVLETGLDKAVSELKRIVKNFRLGRVTKTEIGKAFVPKTDYKKEFQNQKEFSWSYSRNYKR